MNDKATPKTDKLDDTYTIRIPTCLKNYLEKMPKEQKDVMAFELRELMAKHVHLSKFDPSLYLSTEEGQ